MTPEARPNYQIVLQSIQGGASPATERARIQAETGLRNDQVNSAVQLLRKKKIIPEGKRPGRDPSKMGEVRRGIPMKEHLVEAQSTTWKVIVPFLQRNAAPFEISELTNLNDNQINISIKNNHNGKRPYLEYFDSSRAEERKVRRNKRKSERRHKKYPTLHQEREIAFASALVENGAMSTDISVWQLTRQLSEKLGKSWFNEFSYGVVMQEYVAAKISEMKGDRTAMAKYLEVGRAVDSVWFSEIGEDRDVARQALEALATKFR